jgi:cobalt-zinc-cadmium efflux system outer membrane protein
VYQSVPVAAASDFTAGSEEPAEQKPAEPRPEKPADRPVTERLQLPADLPGSSVPRIKLPENKAEREEAIKQQFPALPALPEPYKPAPGPDGKPLTLASLRDIAYARNPLLRQANASVEAARGVALQVGLYPNPRVGYVGDSINQANTAGSQGGFVEQTIKTGHKLQLARGAALVDVEIAEFNLRRAEIDLLTQVRRNYYSVLAAERSFTVARALATLSNDVYTYQVARLRGGEGAAYEPLQARVLAVQARASLLQAQNRLISAWRQLAATLSTPNMPPTALAGSLDSGVPRFIAADVLTRVLANHTDVRIADRGISRAQLNLRLAEVTPRPDVDLHYQVEYDKTAQPNNAMHGVSIGVQLPLWNRNQGSIREAQANLARASDEPERVRNDLTTQVAAAFERYDNNRALVLMYRDQIIPDQVRAYRSLYFRYSTEKPDDMNFNDVVTAQQTLADAIRSYIDSIGNLWDSVVDVGALLQVDDLDLAVTGPDSHDPCHVPSFELAPSQHKDEQPAPKPRLDTPQAPARHPQTDEEVHQAMPHRVSFDLKQIEWSNARVPFEVRQLTDGKQRIVFNVVPLQ